MKFLTYHLSKRFIPKCSKSFTNGFLRACKSYVYAVIENRGDIVNTCVWTNPTDLKSLKIEPRTQRKAPDIFRKIASDIG